MITKAFACPILTSIRVRLLAANGVTGGRTFPANNLKRVGDAAAEVSIELRNQYLVTYRPNNLTHDGK